MTEAEASTGGATAARTGLVGRAVGVLLAPRATYADVTVRPQPLGTLFLVLAVIVAADATFFSTDSGRQALLDRQVRTLESFGRQVSDAQYQRFEQMLGSAPFFISAAQIVVIPAAALVLSGLLLAVFNGPFEGHARFSQVFSVVVHSGAVMACQQLVTIPLNYARESLSSPTNLTVFLPFLDESSFPARLLGSIDVFVIWWTISLAIGLGVLYRRRTAPIAWSLFAVYATAAAALAAVKSALSGA